MMRPLVEDSVAGRASILSTTGALVLGVGIGGLMGEALGSLAWAVAVCGLVAHVSGMILGRRALRKARAPSAWEQRSYWICWLLLAAGLGVAASRILL
jgi:hypothetical protein